MVLGNVVLPASFQCVFGGALTPFPHHVPAMQAVPTIGQASLQLVDAVGSNAFTLDGLKEEQK